MAETQILEVGLLDSLGLTAAQKELRLNGIGGSDANTIMAADPARLIRLWEEKTRKVEGEDLSDILPVVMGQYTEELNAAWYEKQTGDKVTDRNLGVSQSGSFRAANLDGRALDGLAIWEAKHVNAFSKMDEVVERYMPQLHHNMHVDEKDVAILSVFKGTFDYEWFRVELDPFYLEDLLEAENSFWKCVQEDTPPAEIVERAAPPAMSEMRKISMEGNNAWADLAADYLLNEKSSKIFTSAKEGLKKLVKDDVREAAGHGLIIKRSKGNSLLFSKEKK